MSKAGRRTHSRHNPTNLHEVVAAYIVDYRQRAKEELDRYAALSNLREAISLAALATNHEGKRMSHQRRIPARVLRHADRQLLMRVGALQKAKTFEDLHDIVATTIGGISGVGELTIYDTAHRIGAFLRLDPERVYLHAGTRRGAQALGIRGFLFVYPRQLPKEFRRLRPYEIEDCLCIYLEALRWIAEGGSGRRSRQLTRTSVLC